MVARPLLVRRNKGKLEPMTTPDESAIREAFRTQAAFCRSAGSPLTGEVCAVLAERLDRKTQTGATILGWPGNPMADALMMRITGGLNALARSGRDPALSALYRARNGDLAREIPRVLAQWDDWLLPWLEGPPQTNEVARAGALWPGIMAVADRFGPDVELLELGASAGLNLNLDRFGYVLDGIAAGDPGSGVQLKPEWHGKPPISAPVNVVARAGVDQNPLDVSKPEVVERLMAYVWPDQDERVTRIGAAIALAQANPPLVIKADAADWLEDRLTHAQPEGVARIVYHSIVLQYVAPEGRARIGAAMQRAGATASAQRPLAWLSYEFPAVAPAAEIRLTLWPGGESRPLGHAHPHGAVIDWTG
jgi:hypothetical protein